MDTLTSEYEIFTEAKRGGRNYMEDVLCVKVSKEEEPWEPDGAPLVYLAVFDGHGGPQAAGFAKEHLLNEITKQKGFWTDDEAQVCKAIKDGFLSTHKLMWKAVDSWPKTSTGLPSTAGTTASVVLIRNKKVYVAHVGDSSVVFGTKVNKKEAWSALTVTKEHKPDCPDEMQRIEDAGGQVMNKAGIARVVWRRPRVIKGPVRRSTVVDNIPFLAIARSLGDLWSYDSERDVFVVSPEPDVAVFDLDDLGCQCIILASDGVWNMIGAEEAMHIVCSWATNREDVDNESHAASLLVQLALERWQNRQIRADNTSAIVLLLNPSDDHLKRSESLVQEKLDSTFVSPTKSHLLLPLCPNLPLSAKERIHASTSYRKGAIREIHTSKEDRVGAKWRKMKRRHLSGLRVRRWSSGLGDSRSISKIVKRRYTLPAANCKSTCLRSCFIPGDVISSEFENFVKDSNKKIYPENPQKSDKELQNNILASPLQNSCSLDRNNKVRTQKKSECSIEPCASVECPVNQELLLRTTSTPKSLSVDNRDVPSLTKTPENNNFVSSKRTISPGESSSAKRMRPSTLRDICETHRTRFQTHLRIALGCRSHAE